MTIVRAGFVSQALLAVAEACDSLEGDWRVLCCSTPNTILRDIQQSRNYFAGKATDQRIPSTQYPERNLLSKIGRTDLLDRSLT